MTPRPVDFPSAQVKLRSLDELTGAIAWSVPVAQRDLADLAGQLASWIQHRA